MIACLQWNVIEPFGKEIKIEFDTRKVLCAAHFKTTNFSMTWSIWLDKQNQKFETTMIILLDHCLDIVYLNAKAIMLILYVIGLQLDIANNSAQKVWQKVEFVFGKDLLNHQLFWCFFPIL